MLTPAMISGERLLCERPQTSHGRSRDVKRRTILTSAVLHCLKVQQCLLLARSATAGKPKQTRTQTACWDSPRVSPLLLSLPSIDQSLSYLFTPPPVDLSLWPPATFVTDATS